MSRDRRSGPPLRAAAAAGQGQAATHELLLSMSSGHGTIFAMRDVAKQGRSVHRYGLGGDCAMPKLSSL
jgi:hypothetical protein